MRISGRPVDSFVSARFMDGLFVPLRTIFSFSLLDGCFVRFYLAQSGTLWWKVGAEQPIQKDIQRDDLTSLRLRLGKRTLLSLASDHECETKKSITSPRANGRESSKPPELWAQRSSVWAAQSTSGSAATIYGRIAMLYFFSHRIALKPFVSK